MINIRDLPEINLLDAGDFLLGIDAHNGLCKVSLPLAARGQQNRIPMKQQLKFITIGDSFMALGNFALTPTAITAAAGIATCTCTGHQLFPGAEVLIGGVRNEEAYNGLKTVLTTADANTFTYAIDKNVTAAASGALRMTSQIRYQDRNFVQYAAMATGFGFSVLYNMGVSGERSADTLARIYRDALDYDIDGVMVHTCYNDINNSVPYADIIANLERIYRTIHEEGKIVVGFTAGPFDSAVLTAAQAVLGLRVNNWLQEFAAENSWFNLVDTYSIFVDAADATGDFRSGYSSDSVHPAAIAAQRAGAALATIMEKFTVPAPYFCSSVYDHVVTDDKIRQMNQYALFAGTGGTSSGSVSGSIAAGWNITESGGGSVVASKQTRANGVGSNQRMVITSAADDDRATLSLDASIHALFAEGDIIQFECEVIATALTLFKYLTAVFSFVVDGTTYTVSALNTSGSAGWADAFTLRLRSPKIRLPGAPTNLDVLLTPRFSGIGGGTFDFGQCSIMRWRNEA